MIILKSSLIITCYCYALVCIDFINLWIMNDEPRSLCDWMIHRVHFVYIFYFIICFSIEFNRRPSGVWASANFFYCCISPLIFRYDHSTAHALLVVFSVLLFHFLLTGVTLATFCWYDHFPMWTCCPIFFKPLDVGTNAGV